MEKQQVMNLFESTRGEFLDYCRWVAVKIAKRKGNVTIDDIRAECPVPLGLDARAYGAVFRTPEWVKVGYTSTTTKSSHGRPIAIFNLRSGI